MSDAVPTPPVANVPPAADTNMPPADAPKPADAPPADAPKDEPPKADDAPKPIEYTDFTIPEGVTLPDGLMAEVKTMAQSLNMTQEQAQALADLQSKQYANAAEAYTKQVDDWLTTAKADPEYGQAKFDENVALATAAIDKFAPELKQFLNDSGFGNHPDMIRAWVRVGKLISNDKFESGSTHNGKKDPASVMYDKK